MATIGFMADLYKLLNLSKQIYLNHQHLVKLRNPVVADLIHRFFASDPLRPVTFTQ